MFVCTFWGAAITQLLLSRLTTASHYYSNGPWTRQSTDGRLRVKHPTARDEQLQDGRFLIRPARPPLLARVS